MSGRRPYFSRVLLQAWAKPGQPDVPGIALIGAGGFSAHLTALEAIDLSNVLVDLAEQLETLTKEPTA